jgi:hypothetical protein
VAGIAAATREAGLKQVVTGVALLSGLAAALILAGVGLALLLIADSGARGSGALLLLGGGASLIVVLLLVFTRERTFSGPVRSAGAVAAGILAAMPAAGLAFAAFRFTWLPFGSPLPMIDWPVFAAGVALALGAVAIVALGYRRSQEAELSAAPLSLEDQEQGVPVVHMQQIRHAQQQLQSAFENAPGIDDDGEVRVRRV